MKLTEVQFQPWHTLVLNFFICQNCSWVDSDSDRMRIGSPCKRCGEPSPSARLHFGRNSTVLVNSIQDFYFLRHASLPPNTFGIEGDVYSNDTDTRIVIPLLFCTLCEGLTTELCRNIMRAKGLDERIQERLLSDHMYAKERREKLFTALTGEKWNAVLSDLSKTQQYDFSDHFSFFLLVSGKRNQFIHEGSHWHFKDEELERIPEELKVGFYLFAQLHNRYVPLTQPPIALH